MITKKAAIKGIERHLFSYRHYLVAIKNLNKQLDYIMPNITANYEISEGSFSGTFTVSSSTENAAIDRIESRRALNLYEEIQLYELIISCIDSSLDTLSKPEVDFVKNRYFDNLSVAEVAEVLGYSVPHIYKMRDQVVGKLVLSLASILELKE